MQGGDLGAAGSAVLALARAGSLTHDVDCDDPAGDDTEALVGGMIVAELSMLVKQYLTK